MEPALKVNRSLAQDQFASASYQVNGLYFSGMQMSGNGRGNRHPDQADIGQRVIGRGKQALHLNFFEAWMFVPRNSITIHQGDLLVHFPALFTFF